MNLDKTVAKDIIWKNPGITSYGLLAKLIEMGYQYQHVGENSFDKFIQSVASDINVRHTADDKFYTRKAVQISIFIESERLRTNCYNCDFCCKLEDNAELRRVNKTDADVYCALNPQIQLKRQVHFPHGFECPLNIVIRKIQEDKNRQEE